MTISISTLKAALAQYVDTEVIAHLNDHRKWLLGIGGGIYINKVDGLIAANKDMLVGLGYLTEDNEIEIDKIYKDFREQADKRGDIKVTLPMLGEVSIGIADIDKLYKYAIGGISSGI